LQLVDRHHSLAQPEISMKGQQVPVDAIDEARVDRHGDVRTIERQFHRGPVFPRVGEEQDLLHFAVHGGTHRPAETAERGEERGHDLLAIGAVWQGAQIVEGRLVELHRPPIAERDRRIGKVGV
jgi:hypothetical protein